MKSKELEVLVVARRSNDLNELAGSNSPLESPCGASGPSIARKVLEGGGRANISIEDLKSAFDNQLGVQSIFDNFELYDSKTKRPLIFSLIVELLK